MKNKSYVKVLTYDADISMSTVVIAWDIYV